MGLSLSEALPYRDFAEHLEVELWTPADVPGLEDHHIHQLTVNDKADWSAVTLSAEERHLIIMNSSHSERRLANDVVHELSHILLDHQKARLEVSEEGHMWLKSYGKDQEDEADWLAGALLLPRDGLLSCYRKTPDISALATLFKVSNELVQMRVNRTGVKTQVHRSRRQRRA